MTTRDVMEDLWVFNTVLGQWSWIAGSNSGSINPNYGTKGQAADSNDPGSRSSAPGFRDSNNNVWLFGGSTNGGYVGDLWTLNVSSLQWTWISGPTDGSANYGTKRLPNPSNTPGGRNAPLSWIDSKNNFWIFGGYGFGALPSNNIPQTGLLNDLWRYNISSNIWTWMDGSSVVVSITGPIPPNNDTTPGYRSGSTTWVDSSDNLWLYGGGTLSGKDSYSDLWKFDQKSVQWVFVAGSRDLNSPYNYGTQNVFSSLNTPGSRDTSISWISHNELYLFAGYNDHGNYIFDDLWKYSIDPTAATSTVGFTSLQSSQLQSSSLQPSSLQSSSLQSSQLQPSSLQSTQPSTSPSQQSSTQTINIPSEAPRSTTSSTNLIIAIIIALIGGILFTC